MDPRVSVIRTMGYGNDEMERAVEQHFSLLEADRFLRPGMKVALKPNLLMRRTPEEATTTHPSLVRAVVRALQGRGIEDIVIADSPGGPYSKTLLGGVYEASGLAAVALETGAKLNTGIGWQELRGVENGVCREWSIIDPLAQADAVINLPKLKTHAMVTLSGAVKNLFGAVPGLQKPQLHFRFPEQEAFCRMLVELAELIKPCLTIVDGVVSMEGDGPSGGKPRETNLTFGGRDVFSLDVALCDFVGLSPQAVWTVRHAAERGMCPENAAGLVYLGDGRPDPVADFKMPKSGSVDFANRVPSFLRGPVRALLTPRPIIQKKECIGCGKCAESCAPQAAIIREGKAAIDYGRCIRCFCCHEMCPVKAISIKRTILRF